jgi:hypothetical protein
LHLFVCGTSQHQFQLHICSITRGGKIVFCSLSYDLDEVFMFEGGILLNIIRTYDISMC